MVEFTSFTDSRMDQGGCQLSGGGGGGDGPQSGSRNGMITLEDLESFSDEQLTDSGNGSLEEEGETMEEDEDRLLHYWQDVARGHQVEVPQGKNHGDWRTNCKIPYLDSM